MAFDKWRKSKDEEEMTTKVEQHARKMLSSVLHKLKECDSQFFKHAGLQIDDEEQVEEVMKAGPKGLAVLRALVYEAFLMHEKSRDSDPLAELVGCYEVTASRLQLTDSNTPVLFQLLERLKSEKKRKDPFPPSRAKRSEPAKEEKKVAAKRVAKRSGSTTLPVGLPMPGMPGMMPGMNP